MIAPVVLAVELWVIVVPVAAILASGVVAPTAPVKVMTPEPPVKVRAWAPLRVWLKVMFALLEVMLLFPIKLTGRANTNGLAPDTVIALPI